MVLRAVPVPVAGCPTHSARASFDFAAPPDARLSHTSQNQCRPACLRTCGHARIGCVTFPSFIFLVPSLRGRKFVASSHEATSLIQLGSLRFGQVCLAFRHRVNVGFIPNVTEAVPDPSPHDSVRPSCRCAPFRPTLQASEHCRTVRYERCSRFRQDDGLPPEPTVLPAGYGAALGERSAWHHVLSRPTRGKSRGFASLPIQLVHPAIRTCTARIHQQTICLPNCCRQRLGVSTHESYRRASGSVLLNRVVHQASLPLEFVTSRGLSLMLMSRRKVHAGLSVGWTCPTIDAAPSPAHLVHNSDTERFANSDRLDSR